MATATTAPIHQPARRPRQATRQHTAARSATRVAGAIKPQARSGSGSRSRGYFRRHTTAPDDLASPLLRHLCREWVDLQGAPAAAAAVTSWRRTEPALKGCDSPGDVVDVLDRAPRDLVDQILRCLLHQLHQGDQVAGRVLLQAMLGCLTNLARRCSRPREVEDADEQLQRTIAEFWSVIAQPRPLPDTGLAGRLQLDTLKRLTAHRRSPDAWEEHTSYYPQENDWLDAEYRLNSHADLGNLADTADTAPTTHTLRLVVDDPERSTGYDPDAGLYEVVVSARANGVLTADEAQFLADVYLVPEAGDNLAAAARRLGLSPAAVRQRCCRIRGRLIAAVLDESAGALATAS